MARSCAQRPDAQPVVSSRTMSSALAKQTCGPLCFARFELSSDAIIRHKSREYRSVVLSRPIRPLQGERTMAEYPLPNSTNCGQKPSMRRHFWRQRSVASTYERCRTKQCSTGAKRRNKMGLALAQERQPDWVSSHVGSDVSTPSPIDALALAALDGKTVPCHENRSHPSQPNRIATWREPFQLTAPDPSRRGR